MPEVVIPLSEQLENIRKQVDKLRPENCCLKTIMTENNGRVYAVCVNDCPWQKLDLDLAIACVDAAYNEGHSW